MTLGVKPSNFAVLGGQMGSNGGQLGAMTRILIFEPGRHMRGVSALFFVAGFNHRTRLALFGLFGVLPGSLGVSWGSIGGQNVKMLNFEPGRQMGGVLSSFFVAGFSRAVKSTHFGLKSTVNGS